MDDMFSSLPPAALIAPRGLQTSRCHAMPSVDTIDASHNLRLERFRHDEGILGEGGPTQRNPASWPERRRSLRLNDR